MGFEIVEDGEHTVGVSGQKNKLMLNNFGMFRDTATRMNEPAVAQLMMNFMDRIMSNPAIVQMVGPKFLFDRINEVAEFFQLPTDFRLPADMVNQPTPEQAAAQQAAQQEQQQQAMAAVQQVAAQTAQQVTAELLAKAGQDITQGIAEPLAQQQRELAQALSQFIQQTNQAIMANGESLQQVGAQSEQIGQAVAQLAGENANNRKFIDQLALLVAQLEQTVSGGQPAPMA
jgi:phosphatidylserine/phosphatidylglycerophosphate/cardiolipin synthase-like enzyme